MGEWYAKAWRWLGAAALMGSVSACVSPTLPLPPPESPDDRQFLSDDEWQISGTCIAGAEVTVFNTVTGQGVVILDEDGDGRYSVVLDAQRCDLAWVSQEQGNEESGRTEFVIQEASGGVVEQPSDCQ